MKYCCLIGLVIFSSACRTDSAEDAAASLFSLMEHTGIDFSNDVVDKEDMNIFNYRNFYNGSGVAIGDINNDGLPDIFFAANMGMNKLYLNKGEWQFEDITLKAGVGCREDWSTGVVMVDINGDGLLDIFVCNAGYKNGRLPESRLFINNRDLTFSDSAAAYGLTNHGGYTTHAAFFDYDLDGDLDCFIINDSFMPVSASAYEDKRDLRAADWPVEDYLKGGGDRLLRNDNGKFTDVSKMAGIHGSLISFGLGVSVGDINGDGYPDVYVSNDFFEKDYLYINQQNGTFNDELESYVQHTSLASMGADIADINNDGLPDIFTTDMLPYEDKRIKMNNAFEHYNTYRRKKELGFYHQFTQNTLQLNSRIGKFYEIAHYSGVAASDWSWGSIMFDADNDGWNDIFVCNGIYRDVTNLDFMSFFAHEVFQNMMVTGKKEDYETILQKMPSVPIPNKVYKNNGDLTFKDIGKEWGLVQTSFSNGSAYGDLDGDGDLDFVVNNVNGPAFVYRNNVREIKKNHHYMGISLRQEGDNTHAIGSLIKIFAGDKAFVRELIPTRGFQSSVDYHTVIGLGNVNHLDSLMVRWPDRTHNMYYHLPVDTSLVITKPAKGDEAGWNKADAPRVFKPVETKFEKHAEDDYVDFDSDSYLPFLISQEGPGADTADVNNDGLPDIYIGGATNQPGQLYIQQPDGSFAKKNNPLFNRFAAFEDTDVLFFDCDGDGDKDLLVCSGGNNRQQGMPELQPRLYINDGNGNFSLSEYLLPVRSTNVSVAKGCDFDGDGDLDLFIGSRSIPYLYGVSPRSFLLENDGKGNFTDVTKSKAPALEYVGLITDALWYDMDGDGNRELILCGEWMSPKIFAFNGNGFEEVPTTLSERYGWWQSVAITDVNKDGKPDLVLGNIGENFFLRPSAEEPVKLWINDFDHNGSIDRILTRTIGGKDMPVFGRNEMQERVPLIKKQDLTHAMYAEKSIRELFPQPSVESARIKEFNYPSSCIALNMGNNQFEIRKLPPMVQLSSVRAICVADINGDGFEDLILGGNQFDFLPQFGRLDASFGHVLLNDTQGGYSWLPPGKSGIMVEGQVRNIVSYRKGNGQHFLFLRNNDYPAEYKLQEMMIK